MKTYQCRRANKLTPGIQDLEEMGELDILKEGQSILPHLWPHDAVWNQLSPVDADNAEIAAISFWLETSFFNQSWNVDEKTGMVRRKCEISWDESDCFLEVQEPSPIDSTTIIRIYRIDFDFDHGFQAILLSKVLVSDCPFKVTRLEFIEDNE